MNSLIFQYSSLQGSGLVDDGCVPDKRSEGGQSAGHRAGRLLPAHPEVPLI